MKRPLVLLAAAAVVSIVALVGCDRVRCSCEAPELRLELCEAARANLVSSEASGACRIDGLEVTILQQAGPCDIVLRYRDGTRSEIHATIGYTGDPDCCGGYYPDLDHRDFKVPHPECRYPSPHETPDASYYGGPDAGCDGQPGAGCFTHQQFYDCACRCKDWDVPVAGVGTYPNSGCTHACGCGFGTAGFGLGCAKDEDCVLVRAGCCPCSSGGASLAVLESEELAWDDQMVGHCGPSGVGEWGCPTVDVCAGRTAVCEAGRCKALAP